MEGETKKGRAGDGSHDEEKKSGGLYQLRLKWVQRLNWEPGQAAKVMGGLMEKETEPSLSKKTEVTGGKRNSNFIGATSS